MKRTLLLTALLVLLATSAALATAPPAIWFGDSFETYVVPSRLATNCVPKWGAALVIEPNTVSSPAAPYGGGTNGAETMNVWNTYPACDGDNYVPMTAWQGNWGGVPAFGIKGRAAQTATGVGWAGLAAGNIQYLHFQMKRSGDYWYCVPDYVVTKQHAGVYLVDSSNQVILGWQGDGAGMKSQLNLPPVGSSVSPEGVVHTFTLGTGGVPCSPGEITCHDFDASYDPVTGAVEFKVDGVLNWSTTIATGRASNSVYVRDYVYWGNGDYRDAMLLDDLAVGTSSKPVVTHPVGGDIEITATPTINWTNAFGSGMTGYRVRVCSADDPLVSIVYDSGELVGSATSIVTTALTLNTKLYAFVNEKYAGWTGWSLAGTGGFYCVTAVPTTPVVSAPSGDGVIGSRPSVSFTAGVFHNQFEVKITTDPAGATIVWESGLVNSLLNGASCEDMLVVGTQYYAFARAANPIGPSAWSSASPFKVTRAGEYSEVMNMDEMWGEVNVLDHVGNAGDDGFASECNDRNNLFSVYHVLVDNDWFPYPWPEGLPMYYAEVGTYLPPSPPRTSPSTIMEIWDAGYNTNDAGMRLHRMLGVSLDKGLTFVAYARGTCYEGEACGGYYSVRHEMEKGCIYVCDVVGSDSFMASFRYGQGDLGICSDGATWTTGSYTDDRSGQNWHLVRITGRNRIVGDPTSTEWNLYLDENPTPAVTATGSVPKLMQPFGGARLDDGYAIGQACGGIVGNWQYDWTSMNTDGDYAPGEWSGQTAEFATVSEALACGSGTQATITGDAVITAIQMDGATQFGFWVQDVGSEDRSNILLITSDTTNVEVGHKVTGISGMFESRMGIGAATVQSMPALNAVTCTVTTEDVAAPPFAMTQKNLVCDGLVDQFPEGSGTTAKFVRIVGRVTEIYGDAVYLDDGCGLLDGRSLDGNPAVLGVRIVDTALGFSGSIGDYYRVDGICASDKWVEDPVEKRVRTILAPTFTLIPEP